MIMEIPINDQLCKSLQIKLNVTICFSNINIEPITNSVINIINATILSKIDYGVSYMDTKIKKTSKDCHLSTMQQLEGL